MNERWKDAPGYEGRYEVSDLGRVRSRRCVLKQHLSDTGYWRVPLRADGKFRLVRVHRLVCEAFNGPPNILHRHVAHLDNNRQNARADNLKWVSPPENAYHKRHHGTHQAGEKHPRAKLTVEQVEEIRNSDERHTDLARRFGVRDAAICKIRNGQRWRE